MILVSPSGRSVVIHTVGNPSVVILRIYKLNHILSIATFHNKINYSKTADNGQGDRTTRGRAN